MRFTSRCILLGVACVMLACAGGPPPPQTPGDIRKGTRYLNKGVTLYARGCYQRALAHFYESHERYTAADNLQGVANSLHSIANIYLQLEDVDSALLVYQEAIDDYRALGDRRGQARAWANYALAWLEAGRLEDAAQALDRADELAGPGDLPALRAKNRALLLVKQQHIQAAEEQLTLVLPTIQDDDPAIIADMHYLLGELQLEQQEPERAVTHLRTALELDRSAGAYHGIARDLAALGICFTRLERFTEAINHQKRSAKIYALLQNPRKVQEVVEQLEANAARAHVNIQSALHWINQWLAGNNEANLCR